MHDYSTFHVNFLGFWKFPETAWWVMNFR